MSQKGRLRRLETDMNWLETEGRFRRLETMMKTVQMLQQIADRAAADPAFAARWQKDFPDFPCELPTPNAGVRPPPRPSIVPETPPPVLPPVPVSLPVPVVETRPPPRPSEPVPGQPVAPPPPEMQIRPVHWRARGSEDHYDDKAATYGRCLTEYDPLRNEYDDE